MEAVIEPAKEQSEIPEVGKTDPSAAEVEKTSAPSAEPAPPVVGWDEGLLKSQDWDKSGQGWDEMGAVCDKASMFKPFLPQQKEEEETISPGLLAAFNSSPAPPVPEAEADESAPEVPTTTAPADSPPPPPPSSDAAADPEAAGDDETGEEKKKPKLPYFHRELDEHTKALIGDITPKPLTTKANVEEPKLNTASAWNAGGSTWEDKNVSSWAVECLQKVLTPFTHLCDIVDEGQEEGQEEGQGRRLQIDINGLTAPPEGHANISIVRSKPRYLYDFSFEMKWKAQVLETGGGEGDAFEGSLMLTDVDNSSKGEYEAEQKWGDGSKRPTGALWTLFKKEMTTPHAGVLALVEERVGEFERQLHEKR